MSDGPIAIVGASCRFPGADGLEGFWQLLVTGRDAVSQIDPQRWSTRFYYHPDRSEAGKSYTWSAGLIGGVDLFEPSFFGISPREAMQMDPQQRLLLELVWHAAEDAGIPASRLSGTETGVYIGASARDYSDLSLGDPAAADSYFMTGNALSILANRISYIFDLRGPSLAVDTACSSSLVALHHACEAIRAERIPAAIVGGVNLLLSPYPFLGFSRAAMLSRRGRCFAFDERADGYVRGEGGGIAVLKPLAQALADGNPIRAVIVGTGSNSDGRTIGVSLPSEAAQSALLRSVYAQAGIPADEVAFFEMHGTGTPAGDPVEAAAVGHALAQGRGRPLPIGSVKSNIGHLEPASGMAGLLKAALALERGTIPPTLHCETPNPNIAFGTLNLRLLHACEPVAPTERYAGVNSFGFGGTNAHVILAAPPALEEMPHQPGAAAAPLPPLLISAATEASLRELARGWCGTLAATPAARLPGLLRAAARGREHHHPHRLVPLGRDRETAARHLADFLESGSAPGGVIAGSALREGKLAFVFSGNGAQFAGMAQGALRSSTGFRAAVETVDDVLRPQLGWSVAELIETGAGADGTARADVAQPLLFAVQVGIVEALRELGVVASGYLGHSVGEIAAAWGAGALSLAEAGRVVVARSRSQQRTQGGGRMAALALAENAARDLLAELDSTAEIAALNAARSVTISGSSEEIERLEAAAHSRGLWFRRLDLDFAFHSRIMDPVRDELLASLFGISSQAPAARLISSVTGAGIERGTLDAEHWWRNIRNPVRFAEGVRRLIDESHRIFVEIGPSAILQSYLADGLRTAEAEGRVLATLQRDDGAGDVFPAIAARCYVAGYDLAGAPRFDGRPDPHGLPRYPWQRERFWLDRTVEAADLANPPFDHPLLGFRQPGAVPQWLNHLGEQLLPWIADHAVEGMPVLPAAAVIETGLALARWRWPDAPVLEVFDVEVRRPLPFDKGRMRELRTILGSDDGDWELASRPRLTGEPLTLHAVGRISGAAEPGALLRWPDIAPRIPSSDGPGSDGPGSDCPGLDGPGLDGSRIDGSRIEGETLYRIARDMGLDYGSRFRTVERVELAGPGGAIVHLDPAPIGEPLDAYLLHPALLDGALQGLLGLLGLLAGCRDRVPDAGFLPWRFGRVRLSAPFGRVPRHARLRVTRAGVRSVAADIALYDDAGAVVAELGDCWLRRVELARRGAADERALRVDLLAAPLAELAAPKALGRAGAALSRRAAARQPERERREEAALLDALIGAAALAALRGLVVPGQSFTIDGLALSGRLAAASRGLALCLLESLERLGAAAGAGAEWRIEPAADLPEPAEIWRLLLADAPDLVAELALVAATVESLPKSLADGPRPQEPRLAALTEHLLRASPASVAGIDLLCDALSEIAAAWPPGRPLRILELAAGGGATRRILDRLSQCETALSYTAASADPEEAARLSFLMQSFSGASARHWSPRDGNADLDGVRFDIVVAVNGCARLQLDAAGLACLRDLLVPGGLFLAAEPEPNAFWDVVFGQTVGWWHADAPPNEGSPMRTAEEWRAELAGAGFRAVGSAAVAAAPWPSAVFWGIGGPPQIEPAAAVPAPARSIVLVAGATAPAAALHDRLATDGHRVARVECPDFLAAGAPAAAADDDRAAEIILFLPDEPEGEWEVGHDARQIEALAGLAARAAERDAALWIVTCDAHQSGPADTGMGQLGAALWGFARVLVNEMPRLPVRLLDLASAAAPGERARQVAAELAADSTETEIVWTAHGRHVLRVRAGLPPRRAARSDVLTLASGSRRSGLDSLGWEILPARPLGTADVEIDVHAAGLNFRDMMWAMGLLPEEALIDGFAGPTFGLECAGIVRALGPAVDGLTVGDRVMAFAPASLGSRVVTTAAAVAAIAPETSFAAAATLPVAFVTATYALGRLAQLAPGEHVLIHSAAGGVGLAAIQYAKHRGAIVTATAGSEVKRSFLRLAGADHVLDSRGLAFADAVREITGGQGVDVVLNSLSGEAMERSLETLKPFGRFLELGKRDLYLNRRLHLRSLRQNISYFAIDVGQLPLRRPDLARSLLAEISALLAAGAIRPLAHRIFSFAEIDDAFRLMQSSGHIGKLVLVPGSNAGVRLREPPQPALRRDGTYLVSGGIDGFGYAAARWLAARGAGSIALLGRRGRATPECEARIAELEAAGAQVQVYQGDVADRAALAAVLDQIRATRPPLRGIVHAAAAIGDGLAGEIDAARIAAVLRPKLGGALALDALTRDDPIELFLLFSSATTMLGAPGQGAYVAANTALEALARRRRAAGRPALAVAWGPIADAGYLAERPETRDALARRLGARPMPARQAVAGLPAMLASGLPAIGFADASWTEARRFLPILATPLFSEIRAKAASVASDEPLGDRLAGLGPEEALALLHAVVADEAAAILRLPADGIDPLRPLSQLGMDSLMAVELRLALESRLHIDLPLVSLAEGTSVTSIAARLAGALTMGAKDAEVAALTARHEGVDETSLATEPAIGPAALPAPRSVAAE